MPSSLLLSYKIEQLENKNQFIILGDNGEVEFQSYDSIIAKISKTGALEFSARWNYSKTTLKHLYIFLEKYLYNLDNFIQNDIEKILFYSKNKKRDIQKLIDNEKIFMTLKY